MKLEKILFESRLIGTGQSNFKLNVHVYVWSWECLDLVYNAHSIIFAYVKILTSSTLANPSGAAVCYGQWYVGWAGRNETVNFAKILWTHFYEKIIQLSDTSKIFYVLCDPKKGFLYFFLFNFFNVTNYKILILFDSFVLPDPTRSLSETHTLLCKL